MAESVFYPSSPIAVAAGGTAEGIADYRNALDKMEEGLMLAFCMSALAAMSAAPPPNSHITDFWGIISLHVLSFLRKYEYDRLHIEFTETATLFVVAVSRNNPDKQEMAEKFATLSNFVEVCQLILKADFETFHGEHPVSAGDSGEPGGDDTVHNQPENTASNGEQQG
ncbi:hypothetical protein TWF694_011253 [Orbilia ellipsospora]|uniref:Uncharacterized protein n=1 Tax=Orbilia ellipsospora TaxID=2528407 RepID=A0AAV9X8G6_9PEZI